VISGGEDPNERNEVRKRRADRNRGVIKVIRECRPGQKAQPSHIGSSHGLIAGKAKVLRFDERPLSEGFRRE